MPQEHNNEGAMIFTPYGDWLTQDLMDLAITPDGFRFTKTTVVMADAETGEESDPEDFIVVSFDTLCEEHGVHPYVAVLPQTMAAAFAIAVLVEADRSAVQAATQKFKESTEYKVPPSWEVLQQMGKDRRAAKAAQEDAGSGEVQSDPIVDAMEHLLDDLDTYDNEYEVDPDAPDHRNGEGYL